MRVLKLTVAFMALSTVAHATDAKPFWSGQSGGFQIEWSPAYIKATGEKQKPLFLVGSDPSTKPSPTPHPLTPPPVDADDAELGELDADYVSILSVVGPYVSLSHKHVSQLAPSASTQVFLDYQLITLENPGKPFSLLEIFPAAELFSALSADRIVQKVLKLAKPKNAPANVEALALFLSNRSISSGKENKFPPEEGVIFPENLLSSAYFHHIDKDRVAVRIPLPGGNPKFQKMQSVGFFMKIPEALADEFRDAATGKAGFLNKNAPSDKQKEVFETRAP